MKKMKASRLAALLLILVLLCGLAAAARADVATLGIYFCGKITGEDGTESIIRLDGKFSVMQNGEEIGTIQAGKETITLPGTERVRIEPLPETISPEWDLTKAFCEVYPEAGGTATVSVIVNLVQEGTAAPAPTAEPAAVSGQDDEDTEEEYTEDEDTEEIIAENDDEEEESYTAVSSGPVNTPLLPIFDASVLAPTPEPEWHPLSAGNGSISVYAYHDQNSNGLAGDKEKPVSGVTVCLLTESGEAVTSVTTDANGIAQFAGLPQGAYRIKAILPTGWAFTKKGSGEPYASMYAFTVDGEAVSDAFTVSDGETATAGIGLNKLLHVSGTCWFESSKVDGLYDKDEPGLGGVRIELKGEKNGLVYETVSDEDGNFYIDRVQPAAYKLVVHAPDGMMFTRAASKNGRKTIIAKDGAVTGAHRVDLNDNESKEKQYVGFTWAGQVTGICFQDANYNGIYDEGDLPMPGVKITAIKQAKDEECAVTYSAEDGTYTLSCLRGNTYKMRAVLPDDGSDFTCTVSDPLGNHFKARPGRRENFWNDFVLDSSETRVMNVGAIYPASVVGYVYLDNDFSGTRDKKEKTVSGYLVKLLDELGNTVAMDKTSVKGKYELTDVPPGNYSLSVTALKDYAFTRQGEGNVILNRTLGEGYSETFTLGLGENKTGMDIGMIRPGTVRGSVFADRNDNGIRDDGENGLVGVTVRLMGEEGEAFSAQIGEDGNYLFDAVMPGTYTLEYTLPENAVFARNTSNGNTISGEKTGSSAPFSMKSGVEVEGPVCGALTLGRIEGIAWMDHNGDGIRTEDEEEAEGMTVTLTPSRDVLDEITVTTGADGTFALEALRPDEYTLTVSCPTNYVMSRTDNLKLPLTAGKAEQSVQLSVAMGSEWTRQEVGAVIPAGVSGQLWLDENNNGLFDTGEQTPAGYEVIVTDDRTGRVFDKLYTDEKGCFATTGMIPGTFTLSFAMDENTIAPKDGSSDFTEQNGKLVLAGLELEEDEDKTGLLLGIVRYTAIGGNVWIDRGNSVQTLGGTQISLKDDSGNVLRTITTGENGAYKFDKLMPGIYQLDAVVPEGCVIIEPGDRRLNAEQVSVIANTVNREGSSDLIDLKMAQDQLKMNIGCVLPGRMGDFCWLDYDGDGLQGMDEPGIPGVKITLMRDGNVVAETVTDQYGFYLFKDLYPSDYILQPELPGEVKPTVYRDDYSGIVSVLGEDGNSVPVSVFSNAANYNADMGAVPVTPGVYPNGYGQGATQNWVK